MSVFALLVVLQSLSTLLRYGNFTLAGIGLLGYLSPLAAIIAFFQFNRGWADAQRWLRFYIVAAAVMSLSVFLQFLGFAPRIFESIGLDTVYGVGGRIAMLCGIMRSSEVAAFHAGAAACLAFTLATIARSPRAQILYASLVPLFLLAIVLGGRRKMLAQFALTCSPSSSCWCARGGLFAGDLSHVVAGFGAGADRRAAAADRSRTQHAHPLPEPQRVDLRRGPRPPRVDDGGQHEHRAVDHRRARERRRHHRPGLAVLWRLGGPRQRSHRRRTRPRARRARATRSVLSAWLAIGVLASSATWCARPELCRRRRRCSSTAGVVHPSHAVVFVIAHQVYGDPFALLVPALWSASR